MQYALIKISNLDAVSVCKEIEKLDGIEVAVLVRSNAERYPEDRYVMTANTTERALARLDVPDDPL